MDGPVIDDLDDPAPQRILELMKPARRSVRTTLIEDAEPVVASLAAGVEFHEVYAIDTHPVPEAVVQACGERDVPVRLMSAAVVNQVFRGDKRPKLFGTARVPRPWRLADLAGSGRDLVVLDGVRIVGNIGAIVRTSFALGAGGIVLLDSDLTTVADRRLVRASRAYVFSLPVVLAGRDETLRFLQDEAIELVRFEADAELALPGLRALPARLGLVFGSEKFGPSGELVARSSHAVAIPMNPAAESLNVSVSVGIALAQRTDTNLGASAG